MGGQGSLIILQDGHHFLQSEHAILLIEKDLAQIARDSPKHKEFNHRLQCLEDANGAWPSLLDESDENSDLGLGKSMNTPKVG